MLKNWLNFSRGERYGIIILFILVCVAALYPYIHQAFFFTKVPLVDTKVFYRVDSFFLSLKYEEKPSKSTFSFVQEEEPQPTEPETFPFDPNTISTADLVRMGLTSRQAAVIDNYRKKGGVFRSQSDFARMYVVSPEMYQRVKPYIQIPPIEETTSQSKSQVELDESTKISQLVVELNTADTIELIKLRGIGRGYARRIVAYRQMLGGYHCVGQLLEVYGFPSQLLDNLTPQLRVDTLKVQKINLNLVDYQDLRRHPYLNDYQARSIIYYRETVGNINELSDIKTNKLVDEKTYERMKHYLTTR